MGEESNPLLGEELRRIQMRGRERSPYRSCRDYATIGNKCVVRNKEPCGERSLQRSDDFFTAPGADVEGFGVSVRDEGPPRRCGEGFSSLHPLPRGEL